MKDLELFREYLTKMRQHCLHQGHQTALSADDLSALLTIRGCASRADLCDRLIGALRDLEQNPGEFIKKHLA